MSNHLDEILYDTAENIFENLAFVLTMPEDDGFGGFDMNDFEPVNFDEIEASEEKLSETAYADFEPPSDNTEAFGEETFEGLDLDDDFGDPASEESTVVHIHFFGAAEGKIFLEASPELLPVIGMNMLGLDDPNALTHEEQKDAFGELLNVICGNLLPAIAGEKAVFNIESAEVHPHSTIPETLEGKPPLASAHFGLEVGHAKLVLFADEKICQAQEASV